MELSEIIAKLTNLHDREKQLNVTEIVIEGNNIIVFTEDDGSFTY